MNTKKIFSLAFSVLCLLGFLFQVQQVSDLYFRFQTTSRTVYQFTETDYYQSIFYCPRFMDLIDQQRLKELGKTFSEHSLEDYFHGLSSIAMKDILELTPPASKMFRACMIRSGRMSTARIFNPQECEAYFKIIKSVNGEKVCYTFMPNVSANYSVGDVASSLTHTSIVYELYFNSSIADSFKAFFISSPIDSTGDLKDPLHSVPFQALGENRRLFHKSKFSVYGDSITINRLPPPFDTNCSTGHDQEACYEECLAEDFKTINRFPWSGFHRQKLDMTMLTPLDFENVTIARFVDTSLEKCHSRCKVRTECLTRFSRTTIQECKSDGLTLASMLPTVPHMSLYAVPFLNLVEYIVQIGSSFGMWFGLSIISFNPMKYIIYQRKEKKEKIVVRTQRRMRLQAAQNRR